MDPTPTPPESDPTQGWRRVLEVGSAVKGLNPLPVLREAIKAVPAVKWALGVAGLAAASSIILYFLGSVQAAVMGVIILIATYGVPGGFLCRVDCQQGVASTSNN